MANKYSIKMEILGVYMCVSTYIYLFLLVCVFIEYLIWHILILQILYMSCYNHMKIVIVIVVICNSITLHVCSLKVSGGFMRM